MNPFPQLEAAEVSEAAGSAQHSPDIELRGWVLHNGENCLSVKESLKLNLYFDVSRREQLPENQLQIVGLLGSASVYWVEKMLKVDNSQSILFRVITEDTNTVMSENIII